MLSEFTWGQSTARLAHLLSMEMLQDWKKVRQEKKDKGQVSREIVVISMHMKANNNKRTRNRVEWDDSWVRHLRQIVGLARHEHFQSD